MFDSYGSIGPKYYLISFYHYLFQSSNSKDMIHVVIARTPTSGVSLNKAITHAKGLKSIPKLSWKWQRDTLQRTSKMKISQVWLKYTSSNHALKYDLVIFLSHSFLYVLSNWSRYLSLTHFVLYSIQSIHINCSTDFSVLKSHHHKGEEVRYHKETITSWGQPQVIITKY